MKNITLTLLTDLIMEAVKGETFIKGRVDKSTDDKAAALAFNEEAGDDEFHKRKLKRTMYTSLSRLVSKIGDYVEVKNELSSDNVASDLDEDTIILTLRVSDRFNESFCDPLAKLCSKYIEDHMLYLWWGTFNIKQAEFYKSLLEFDLKDIQACFNKTAPIVPSYKYTESISTQLGHTIRVSEGEEFTITYQVSDGCIDDVVCTVGNYLSVKGKGDHEFYVKAERPGLTKLTLSSKHNSDIYWNIDVIIT